ncbi:MAG: four helix bundle protein [Candidatus Margulisbacteria bacterium]|nr:four helix bundle protein [Candidatus Margulisiibacteriota bacterium]
MENKSEALNPKQYLNTEKIKTKRYDLEDRTLMFTSRVKQYARKLAKTTIDLEIMNQMFRAAASVGANYIEANDSLGRKDFFMRIRICKKESKETIYWLRLSEPAGGDDAEKASLIQEATELMKIFGSILVKA